MHSGAEEHVIYQISNAPLRRYPYPHLYVEDVFPRDYYRELRRNWPDASQLVPLGSTGRVTKDAYPERFVMPLTNRKVEELPPGPREFWEGVGNWMLGSQRLQQAVVDKFEPSIRERFGSADGAAFGHEILVVRDHTNYKLGPHSDSPRRVVSLLFYCPDDDSQSHLGTSIYVPLDSSVRYESGPHYPHEQFRRVATMQYRPNALFAFVKSDTSFHGVEPIEDAGVLRDLILYDIQVDPAHAQEPHRAEPAQADDGGTSLGLRMIRNMLRRR